MPDPPDPIPELLRTIHEDLEDLLRVELSKSVARSPTCEDVCVEIAARVGLPDPHPEESE